MEFADFQSFMLVLLSACAVITAVAGACAVIVKFWKWAHKQSDENAEKLEEHDSFFASDKERIDRLEEKQDIADKQNKLMLKALVTLMSHELDGNHTSQLRDVRNEIQNYLIKNVGR